MCFSENKGKELLKVLIEKHSLCCRCSRKHLLSGFPVTAAEVQKELRSLWRGNLYSFTTDTYTHVYPALIVFSSLCLFTINKREKNTMKISREIFALNHLEYNVAAGKYGVQLNQSNVFISSNNDIKTWSIYLLSWSQCAEESVRLITSNMLFVSLTELQI